MYKGHVQYAMASCLSFLVDHSWILSQAIAICASLNALTLCEDISKSTQHRLVKVNTSHGSKIHPVQNVYQAMRMRTALHPLLLIVKRTVFPTLAEHL